MILVCLATATTTRYLFTAAAVYGCSRRSQQIVLLLSLELRCRSNCGVLGISLRLVRPNVKKLHLVRCKTCGNSIDAIVRNIMPFRAMAQNDVRRGDDEKFCVDFPHDVYVKST